MKNKLNLLLYIYIVLLFVFSCKKDGVNNPISDYSNFKQGAYIYLEKSGNLEFNFTQLATSKVEINVKKYLNGVQIDSVILYVSEIASTDKANWKLVKNLKFSSDSIILSSTGQELSTALGKPLSSFKPGTQYFFYNRIVTKEGLSYDVTNTPGALENAPAYSTSFRWSAFIVCPYNSSDFFGASDSITEFIVVDDKTWQDWSVNDIVIVKKGPENADTATLIMDQVYPNPDYGTKINSFIIKVVKKNGNAIVPPTLFGNYGGSWAKASISGFTTTPTLSPCGYVFSCTGYLGVKVALWNKDITSLALNNFGVPNYGPYTLILQKR